MSNNFHLMVKKYFGEKEITHTSHSGGRCCPELAGVAKSFASHIFQIFSFFAFPTVACVVLCTLCLNNLRATCNRCLRVMQFIAFCRQELRVTPAQVPFLVLFTT